MTGLLWMDDSSQKVEKKIREAATRYRARFGHAPTHCYAHPDTVGDLDQVGRLQVVARINIRPHHFLVGREQPEEKAA